LWLGNRNATSESLEFPKKPAPFLICTNTKQADAVRNPDSETGPP